MAVKTFKSRESAEQFALSLPGVKTIIPLNRWLTQMLAVDVAHYGRIFGRITLWDTKPNGEEVWKVRWTR